MERYPKEDKNGIFIGELWDPSWKTPQRSKAMGFWVEILIFEEQLLGMAVPLGWRLGAPTGGRKRISRGIS